MIFVFDLENKYNFNLYGNNNFVPFAKDGEKASKNAKRENTVLENDVTLTFVVSSDFRKSEYLFFR